MAKSSKRKREDRSSHHQSSKRRRSSDLEMSEARESSQSRKVMEAKATLSFADSSIPYDDPDSDTDPARTANGHRSDSGGDDDGWQIVGSKSQRQKKRRGADDEKVKYPELVFHGKNSVPIRIADLQNLVLYTLADGIAPGWLAFKYAHHTRKVVVLMVPGLEKSMFDRSIDPTEGRPDTQSVRNGEVQAEKSSRSEEFESWKHGKPKREAQVWHGTPIVMNKTALPEPLQPITDVFNEVWPVKAPGDTKMAKVHSPLQALLIAPLPASKVDKGYKGPRPPAEEKSFRAQRTPITAFIHSADELREAEYPVHPAAFTSPEDAELEAIRRSETNQSTDYGWVDTHVTAPGPILPAASEIQAGSITQGLDVYAVDCEMVQTTDDVYSLARISVVDWSGTTILDSFIKPSLPIKNYYTQYSGITPEILANVTVGLADIQSKLLKLFTPSTVLLGHSLESDLNAMKLTHPFIVDTSLIYPHPRGPPLRFALKFLTQKYLHREIQSALSNKGHNSVEDAIAVLDLVKLKCEKGPKWGTSEASGEPIFRRLGRTPGRDNKPRTSALVDYGTPERGYGKEATVAIGCHNDQDIVKGVVRAVNGDPGGLLVRGGGVEFTWARLRELESWRGWSNNNRGYAVVDQLHSNVADEPVKDGMVTANSDQDLPKEVDGQSCSDGSAPTPARKPADFTSVVGQTVSHIKQIYDALPPCTLFIVYSGTGDPREVGRLQKMQTQYKKEFKVKKWDDLSIKWTDDEEQALRKAVEKARDGCGFLCIK